MKKLDDLELMDIGFVDEQSGLLKNCTPEQRAQAAHVCAYMCDDDASDDLVEGAYIAAPRGRPSLGLYVVNGNEVRRIEKDGTLSPV